MFTPMPNVDSAIVDIKLRRSKYDIQDLKLHSKVIESAFSMRRKTLSNCLKSKLGLTQEQVNMLYEKLDFHPQIRGEVLDTYQFVLLSNAIFDMEHQSKNSQN